MSLRFDSLTLKNFGPYRDIKDLSLTTDPSAPIVVIHGENTLGKTRLFRALRWCLYGSPEVTQSPQHALTLRGLAEYMNTLARNDGETEMQVNIAFSADGHKYNLTRTATFAGAVPRVSADLRIDSSVIAQASIDAEIGRLLHPQISEFFLFDAERLSDFYEQLNSSSERDLLRDSIENVLGIPALQLAEYDVSSLARDVLARQARAVKNKSESAAAERQILTLRSRQESLDKDRLEIQRSVRQAQNSLEDVRDRIAAVEELRADAREMETLESATRGAEEDERRLREEMKRLLSVGWLAPAAVKLTQILEQVRAANDAAQSRVTALREARDRVDFLRTQIQGGSCPQCQQQLPPPDDTTHGALTHAEADLRRLQDEGGDSPDLHLERRVSALIDTTTVGAYQEKQERLDKLIREQFERKRRLNSIKDRLKDNDASMIRELANEQDRLEDAVESFESALKTFKPEQDRINAQQDKLATTIRKLGATQPTLAAEAQFFEYVRKLLGQTIDRYKETTRAEVERVASETFIKLIRDPQGYKGLRIDPTYRVEIIGDHGEVMATSEGGRQLVALSLIGALKRAAVRGGPVVLDSPLGRLDMQHRENVLQTWVPELGDQAILLVQSGELTVEQARGIMGTNIGQEYRIYRPNSNPWEASIERVQ